MSATVTRIHSTDDDYDPETLTWAQACEQAGITYRELDYWTRTERIKSVRGPLGSGTPRLWNTVEVLVAKYAKRLMLLGFTLDPALTLARRMAVGEEFLTLGDDTVMVMVMAS